MLKPAFSVIAEDAAAIGHAATELLFRRAVGDVTAPEHVAVDVRLAPRGSGEIPPPGETPT